MGILYIGKYAKSRSAALEFSSIHCVLKPMGIKAWVSCLLPSRCTPVRVPPPVGLGFKGLEMAL